MRSTTLALALASAGVIPALAQQTAAPAAAPTPTAISPATGKARSTPDATVIPGSSTTGNATGPGGTTGPAHADATMPQGAAPVPNVGGASTSRP